MHIKIIGIIKICNKEKDENLIGNFELLNATPAADTSFKYYTQDMI